VNANTNLERRLTEHYAAEPPTRAPDRVLLSALATIDTTRQRRRFLAPWRSMNMPTYAKLGAALAVLAVVAVGIWQLAPREGSRGSTATPTPSMLPTTAPTISTPTQAPYVPPELTETFTSDIHGFTISYPAGWTAQPATEPWTGTGFMNFRQPGGDFLYDPARADHLFLAVASQPIGDASVDQWSADMLATIECTSSFEPVVVDGTEGVMASDCGAVFVSRGGRGYLILSYVSNDDADLQAWDQRIWFEEVLATIQLRPRTAID
jgi:hypothetical protein